MTAERERIKMHPRRILIDTDSGVDDILALLFLFRLAHGSQIDAAATFGNVPVERALQNISLFESISALSFHQTFRGAAGPLCGKPHFALHVHGSDGLGGTSQQWRHPQKSLAPDLLASTDVSSYDAIIAIGPLSDIAVMARKADLSAAPPLHVMGGAFEVPGNVSPFAEFNINSDPEAAQWVFETYPGDICIVPLDVSKQVVLTRQHLAALCAENPCQLTIFLNAIHQHYMDYCLRIDGLDGCYPHDSVCVFAALFGDMLTWEPGRVHVVLEGAERGRTVLAPAAHGRHHVGRCIDERQFLKWLRRAIVGERAGSGAAI
jgi:purine nucleosidase